MSAASSTVGSVAIRGFEQARRDDAPAIALDESQAAVLALPDDAVAAVLGAPGTGKTTALIELVADRVQNRGWAPEELLVLSPTRAAATGLRDRIARRLAVPTLGPLARTATSVAFQVMRDAAVAQGLPAPTLLTGAEQDQIVASLIEGDLEEGTGPQWPESLNAEVRSLRGFRTQLRDLMMRAVEHGVPPDRLAELGRAGGREEWVAAAEFIRQYQGVLALFRDRSFDAAELVSEAAGIIADSGLGGAAEPRLLLVDDAQELTQSALSLVRALASRGTAVIAFGDPDISTGSFRGARTDVVGRLGPTLGLGEAVTLVLDRVHRHGEAIREAVSAIAARIGTAGAGVQRRALAAPADGGAGAGPVAGIVSSAIVSSAAEELAVIARRLRERHVFDGIPWSEMAVVVRSGSQMPRLARGLAGLEVPARASASGTALRDERAVSALILALEVGLGRRELNAETAEQLLTGPIGGLDAVSLRRLKAALRHEEIAGGGDRPGAVLLAESLTAPSRLSTIDTRVARRAARLAESLAGVAAEAASGATIEELLWGVWHRSGLERQWYEQSLGTGIVAEEANRNLDAVVALFSAAKRFVERMPDFTPNDFLDEWVAADVPEDTLAPRAAADAVAVGTPAAMIGREFAVVVVAGLQQNVWPNPRVRGSLLGADELVRRLTTASPDSQDARLAVMHDELRMFAQAASRASQELLVTAVENDDMQASPFLRLVPGGRGPAPESRALSLRGLVGRLRRELTTGGSPAAASALARLAADGVPGADPAQWYGLRAPSTVAPRADLAAGELVHISPSRMKAFETCPLHWLIEHLGGGTSTLSSGLGTLVHAAAERAAEGTPEELWALVEERWGELSFEAGWQSEAHKEVAREMTGRLAAYLADFARSGGRLLDTEVSFTLPVGPGVLRGTIDRVEQTAEGTAVIVDLKTGRNEPVTDAGVADHPQLGAYQLAFASGVVEGELRLGGAKLVIVSDGTRRKPYRDPAQPAFDEEQLESFRQRVADDAAGMAAGMYLARLGSHCLDPWTPGSCRIHVIKAVSS